jgi:hypothetical protein
VRLNDWYIRRFSPVHGQRQFSDSHYPLRDKKQQLKENTLNDATQHQLVADVARDLVSQVAPEEMPLFRATSEAYFKDPQQVLKEHMGKDDMLGFGTGEVMSLVTPVAVAVSVEVIRFVTEEVTTSFKAESAVVIAALVKSLFKKYRPILEREAKPTSSPLTPEQLREVHAIALTKARQLKLSEAKAKTLADALVGDLVVAG